MPMRFDGRTAIVAKAARGIGQVITRSLASAVFVSSPTKCLSTSSSELRIGLSRPVKRSYFEIG